MSTSPKNAPAAVATPAPAPYTGSVLNGRITASAPWWQDVIRFWVPMLGIGGAVLLQMISVQRQVGELRTDMAVQTGALREEIGTLRSDLQGEMATLRSDVQEEIATLRNEMTAQMATLRADVQEEIATLRNDLGERIARLEALMEILLEGRAQDAAPEPGDPSADHPPRLE